VRLGGHARGVGIAARAPIRLEEGVIGVGRGGDADQALERAARDDEVPFAERCLAEAEERVGRRVRQPEGLLEGDARVGELAEAEEDGRMIAEIG